MIDETPKTTPPVGRLRSNERVNATTIVQQQHGMVHVGRQACLVTGNGTEYVWSAMVCREEEDRW